MSQETVSIKIERDRWESLRSQLSEKGFKEEVVANEYVLWRMSGVDIVAILYSSGKLVLQGLGAAELGRELGAAPASGSFEAHIGVDEVGKGDYFGPLVVVACFVSEKDLDSLKLHGIADSKKISDSRILSIGAQLENSLEHQSVVVPPSKYNSLVKSMGNISVILAHKHAQAVKVLMERLDEKGVYCNRVVFDQFSKRKDRLEGAMRKAGLDLEISQFHKGEDDIAVAAASVLARYTFLKEWEKMEKEHGFTFPKGASNVIDSAKEFVSLKGADSLNDVAKVSFKTTQQVLSLL